MNNRLAALISNNSIAAFNVALSDVMSMDDYSNIFECSQYILLRELASKNRIEMIRLVLKKEIELDYVYSKDWKKSCAKVADRLDLHVLNNCFSNGPGKWINDLLNEEAANVMKLIDEPLFYFYDAVINNRISLLRTLFAPRVDKRNFYERANPLTEPEFRPDCSLPCTTDGKTLLDYALQLGSYEMIELVWANVKTAVCLEDGETALHYFVRNGQLDCARYFLDRDHSILNAARHDGKTALHLAVENGDVGFAGLLLHNRADINILTDNDDTLLHIAAKQGNLNMVDLLFESEFRCALSLVNKDEKKPLTLAIDHNHFVLVMYFLSKGASVHNHLGRHAAQYARMICKNDAMANVINEFIFWEAYNEQYKNEIFKIRTLPEKANMGDILAHAVQDNNRTRQICNDLGWVSEEGLIWTNRHDQFPVVAKQHALFWRKHHLDHKDSLFTTTNLPRDATIEEILYYAKNNPHSRTRKICVKELHWMDANGNPRDEAPCIEYKTKSECEAAFLNLYNRKLQRQWVKKSELPDNPDLDVIIAHAQKNRGRSLEVCMILGWLDENADVMPTAPSWVKEAENKNVLSI